MNELQFQQISKYFQRRLILNQVALPVWHGHCTLLTGQNGSGKTTLLRILAGFEKPDSFEVETGFGVLNWRQYRKTLQANVMYLHQQPYMFEGSVRANLEYALPRSWSKLQRAERVQQGLQWAVLEPLAETKAKHLSGGEYQRVALARAWLRQPHILLLDEPTANMDQEARLRTVHLLRQLRDEGMALVVASHDPDYFSSLVTDHLHLENGFLQARSLNDTFSNAKVTPLYRTTN